MTVAVAEHHRPAEKMGSIGLAAKSVLAVGSGKGGVGKSSIAVFLAAGLARAGCKVGLLDADVYGPSIPHLLGTTQRPQVIDGRIEPVEAAGMKVMSIGLLVPAEEAVIWRGPMLHERPDPVPPRHRLGRTGLPDRRHAAGHGRRGPVAGPIAAAGGRRGGLHAARRGVVGCREGHRHVSQGNLSLASAWWRT